MPIVLEYVKSQCSAFIHALRCAEIIAEKLYAPPPESEWEVIWTRDGKRDKPNEWPPIPGAYSRVIDWKVQAAEDELLVVVVKDEKSAAVKKPPRRPRRSKAAKADPSIVKDELRDGDSAYVPSTPTIVDPTTPIRCSKRIAEQTAVDYRRFYELSPPLRHTYEEDVPSNENDLCELNLLPGTTSNSTDIGAPGRDNIQVDSTDQQQDHQDYDVDAEYIQVALQPARPATPERPASPSVSDDISSPMCHPETPTRQLSSSREAEEPQAAVSSSDVDFDVPATPTTNCEIDRDDRMQGIEDEEYFIQRAQGDRDTRVVRRKVTRPRDEDEPPPEDSRPTKRMKSVASKVVP